MITKKRVILGKGLGALLGGDSVNHPVNHSVNQGLELDITRLIPGQYQPRGEIFEEDIKDLAASISAQGILQPILVRKKSKDSYEIIAGERRWRAAKLAGLSTIPVIIKEVPDEHAMAIALIENIQRENLNALEEAQALERLSQEFHLTHHQTAEAVGKSRTTVTNLLRLLTLTEGVKKLLWQRKLEVGHAKVLLSLKGAKQMEAAEIMAGKGLSVRDSERLVNRLLDTDAGDAPKPGYKKRVDPDVQRLENELSAKLGAFVAIHHGAQGKGRIQIRYNSLEELEGILAHIHAIQ